MQEIANYYSKEKAHMTGAYSPVGWSSVSQTQGCGFKSFYHQKKENKNT